MIRVNEILKELSLKKGNYIYEKFNESYRGISYKSFCDKVFKFASYLKKNDLNDENIIIYSENSINYMVCDLAISVYGGVSINVPNFYHEEDVIDCIESLNAKCLIYSDKLNIDNIRKTHKDIIFICLQELDRLISDIELCKLKEKEYDKCAKIFFSSGTTSKPKAVMLSLKNIFSGCEPLKKRVKFTDEDIDYLYLPLSHTYGNIYNFMYSLISGMKLYLSSGNSNIISELKEVRPTLLSSVPYIYMKIYELDKNVKNILGNRIKYLFAGGSELPIEIKKSYLKQGLFIYDAYALTETASSLSISYNDNVIDNSVGTIFENIDVKIKDNEILVKGDNIFIGYANNLEYTREVIDEDGYFHTGDLGYIKGKKLYITGRKKRVLKSSKGESIDIDKIKRIVLEIDDNFKDTSIYLKNDKLYLDIYVNKLIEYNIDDLKNIINTKLLNPEKVYKLVIKMDNRIKSHNYNQF